MRNKWYGDNRDLVKWSVLLHLAMQTDAQRILQIAYFRHDDFSELTIDDERFKIPLEVRAHFRVARDVPKKTRNQISQIPFSSFRVVILRWRGTGLNIVGGIGVKSLFLTKDPQPRTKDPWGQVLNYHFSRDMLSPWHVPCA